MTPTREASDVRPPRSRREVTRLLQQIQALMLELRQLEQRGASRSEREPKEQRLERLRWRLAATARRAANGDLAA